MNFVIKCKARNLTKIVNIAYRKAKEREEKK